MRRTIHFRQLTISTLCRELFPEFVGGLEVDLPTGDPNLAFGLRTRSLADRYQLRARLEERVMYALGPGHHSRSGAITRRSDASNEWVICLFDFTGKDCHINGTPSGRPKLWPNQHQNKLGAINPGESHGSRCTVHHWLHCVLGTDWLAQRAMRTPISLVRRLTM